MSELILSKKKEQDRKALFANVRRVVVKLGTRVLTASGNALNHDAIERQLAHTERNSVRAAYNHADHLPERIKMMQAWADYLDGLKG